MWVSPLNGGNWKALKQYIKNGQARTNTLNSSDITNIDPETWPPSHTVNNTGHDIHSLLIEYTGSPFNLNTKGS